MRTREIPMIPRAGSEAMAAYNRREELKARRKVVKPIRPPKRSESKAVSISKVLASSGIASGEVVRVSGGEIAEEKKPSKMTEMEYRMADYLQEAEKVVNPPEEAKVEEPKKAVVAPELGLSIDETKPALVSGDRMSRRKRRKMKREGMLKAGEESVTGETV